MDDWIFEIKAIRALKVEQYGQPYSAIANININGDNAYIDGLMTKEHHQFTRDDFDCLIDFCRQLELSTVNFDRYKNQMMRTEAISLKPKPKTATSFLKVVN